MEIFDGKTRRVKLSGGATYELWKALTAIGKRGPDTDDLRSVLKFIAEQMNHSTETGRGFSLCPPPTELSAPGRLRCFAGLLASFLWELARETPDPSLTDIAWNRDLRMIWLANLSDLYRLIGEAMPPGGQPGPLDLELSPQDAREVEVKRLVRRKEDADDPQSSFELTERILELLSLMPRTGERKWEICRQYESLAELHQANGEAKKAVEALKTAAGFIRDDPEGREYGAALLAYATELADDPDS